VCVLSFDDEARFAAIGAEAQGAARRGLTNIAPEALQKAASPVDCAVCSSTEIALVLHLETGAVPENLVPLLMEISGMAEKFCGYSVSAAAGSVVSSVFAINDSFEEAQALLTERFFSGAGTIVMGQGPRQREQRDYPRHTGEKLYQAVLSGDARSVPVILDEFAQALRETTYEYARMHLNTIVMETLSRCLRNSLPADANSFHALTGELQKTRTLERAQETLTGFFQALAAGYGGSSAAPPLVQDAVNLAAERYQDPGFSVNTAAEAFNITPAYFNRLFKKYQRVSYSEFLNEYRMEKARSLLKETSQSVTAVAAAVGISNAPYFYTLFKKFCRVTPQQFRNALSRTV
jgi:YesN/AraC family two-component response regulator